MLNVSQLELGMADQDRYHRELQPTRSSKVIGLQEVL